MVNFMKEKRTLESIYSILGYIGIYYIFGIIIQLLFSKLFKGNLVGYQAVTNFTIYLVMTVVLVLINKQDLTDSFKRLKKDKNPISKIFIALFCVYFSSYVISVLSEIISHYANFTHFIFDGKYYIDTTSDNQNSIVIMVKSEYGILMFISAALLGPICEELMYRKGLMGIIKKEEISVIISSVLFSLVHIISSFGSYNLISLILMFLSYFISGLAFALIYYKTKNIWYSTFAHMIYNTIAMLSILVL